MTVGELYDKIKRLNSIEQEKSQMNNHNENNRRN